MESGRSSDVEKRGNKPISQHKKSKLRHTRQWHELKQKLIAERGNIDELTMRVVSNEDRLTCHHMNLTADSYGEFGNLDDYILLSEASHRTIHWLWQITNGVDFSILDRIRGILERMKELTDEDSGIRHVSYSHRCSDDDARSESRNS